MSNHLNGPKEHVLEPETARVTIISVTGSVYSSIINILKLSRNLEEEKKEEEEDRLTLNQLTVTASVNLI